MIKIIKKISDQVLGRGEYSVSVPPMDGALQTNSLIEEGQSLALVNGADNLTVWGEKFLFSSENQLFALDGTTTTELGKPQAAPILAIAAQGEKLTVAIANGEILTGTPDTLKAIAFVGEKPGPHVTAMNYLKDGTLALCVGSINNSPDNWTRDLLEKKATGSLWHINVEQKSATCLASGLAYPSGVLASENDILVSEAWRHRLVQVTLDGTLKPVLGHLPGYPGRLAADENNGLILSVFAPRSQLIELVLRKTGYRKRMMAEVPQHLWIAPALSSGKSYLEPMQGGAVKQMGILKPWAPTRSYGLVVKLDQKNQPIESFHSRADGKRHGITSAVGAGNSIVMTSRGNGEIIKIGSNIEGSQT